MSRKHAICTPLLRGCRGGDGGCFAFGRRATNAQLMEGGESHPFAFCYTRVLYVCMYSSKRKEKAEKQEGEVCVVV